MARGLWSCTACLIATLALASAALGAVPKQVEDINPSGDSSPITLGWHSGGWLIFSATDGAHGRELWTSGGTAASTEMLIDINPAGSSGPEGLSPSGYFSAFEPHHGREVWYTDGLFSAQIVADISPGS